MKGFYLQQQNFLPKDGVAYSLIEQCEFHQGKA